MPSNPKHSQRFHFILSAFDLIKQHRRLHAEFQPASDDNGVTNELALMRRQVRPAAKPYDCAMAQPNILTESCALLK
jgi:hypothetical protein